MEAIIISDNDGFIGLAEHLHKRSKARNSISIDSDNEYTQPTVGKTIVISINEAITSFEEQLSLLRSQFENISDLIKELSKVRLPINREISRSSIDSNQVVQLVQLQDDIVSHAIDIARVEKDPDNIIALQRVLNLHRHTLDGSTSVDHPIEIVREIVEHSMKQLYTDEMFIEEHSDQVIMDPYHKSIRDQISLIDERLLNIRDVIILPTEGSEYFVAKMVELGKIRRGLTIRDSGSNQKEVFNDLVTLSRKVNEIIMNSQVSHLHDNYIKLIECQHFPIGRVDSEPNVEATPVQKVLGVSLAVVVCGAIIGGFKYLFDK